MLASKCALFQHALIGTRIGKSKLLNGKVALIKYQIFLENRGDVVEVELVNKNVEEVDGKIIVPRVMGNLKHVYAKETSMRGRVLIGEAMRALENYLHVPEVKPELKPENCCLWCGSRQIKIVAKFPEEGFDQFNCEDCGGTFFK